MNLSQPKRSIRSQRLRRVAVVLGLTLFASAARGQYAVEWYTSDGGGGTSAGGNYALSGTIGQPAVGSLTGGNFALEGGFWPGLTVAIPDGPVLRIELVGGTARVSWSPAAPGFALEMTNDLADAPWAAAPAGNPVTIATSGSALFYRLRKP
jgi:hypothetical protein